MTGGQKFIKNKPYVHEHPRIKVTAAECKMCGDIIFSRCRHDKRYCGCGNIIIDGGLDSTYIAWRKKKPEFFKLRIPQTKYQLYDDWNTSANNFGIISIKGTELVGGVIRTKHINNMANRRGRKIGRIHKA